jgi:hypothetical protein
MYMVAQRLVLGLALTRKDITRFLALPLMGNIPSRILNAIVSFDENASFNVGAVLLRGDLSVQTGRRSGDSGPTIGSHTPPKTVIFIHRGELEKVMANFCASLTWLICWGFQCRTGRLN